MAQGGSLWLREASCGSGRLRVAPGGSRSSAQLRRSTSVKFVQLRSVGPTHEFEEPGHSAPGRGSDFLHRCGSQLCSHESYKFYFDPAAQVIAKSIQRCSPYNSATIRTTCPDD